HEHVAFGPSRAPSDLIVIERRRIASDERDFVADVQGAVVAKVDHRVARAHRADDWVESAARENFAAFRRSCRIAVHVTDRERGCPRWTLGDPAAVIADPFAGGQMIDAQDARFETIRWPQPAAL